MQAKNRPSLRANLLFPNASGGGGGGFNGRDEDDGTAGVPFVPRPRPLLKRNQPFNRAFTRRNHENKYLVSISCSFVSNANRTSPEKKKNPRRGEDSTSSPVTDNTFPEGGMHLQTFVPAIFPPLSLFSRGLLRRRKDNTWSSLDPRPHPHLDRRRPSTHPPPKPLSPLSRQGSKKRETAVRESTNDCIGVRRRTPLARHPRLCTSMCPASSKMFLLLLNMGKYSRDQSGASQIKTRKPVKCRAHVLSTLGAQSFGRWGRERTDNLCNPAHIPSPATPRPLHFLATNFIATRFTLVFISLLAIRLSWGPTK